MPRYFKNRRQKEVVDFLIAHGYSIVGSNGDDDIWAEEACSFSVKVPNRNEVIPTGTMLYMVKMICKSGLSKKDILKWWKDNRYGD